MNWNRVEGNWRQLKVLFKGHRGRITGDPLDNIANRRERLIGVMQDDYGMLKVEAERLVKEWQWSEDRAAAFEQALRHNCKSPALHNEA
jgi:uncharacterized protein YjbJ (UPF0337 family)